MSLWRNFLRWAGTKMIIAANNYHKLSDHQYLESMIQRWLMSPARQMQIDSERYYRGDHDILKKRRMVIGENGDLVEVKNLPNNRIIDNVGYKMVDQKKNYLLGQPVTFKCDDEKYVEQLQTVFNKRWNKRLKDLGEMAIIGGIAWLHPYVIDNKLLFKVFPAYDCLPIYHDFEREHLAMLIRYYEEEKTDANYPGEVTRKIEIYKPDGVEYYNFDNNRLVPDVTKPKQAYFTFKVGDMETPMNWERLPIIAFRCNSKEIPILKRYKSLQDALNTILSMFNDHMGEDSRNTIIVLKNYDGENLADFRRKLTQYGAIKIRDTNGGSGGVESLHIEVNAENYKTLISLLKEQIIENCRGFDFSELKSGSPNQMNIKSILSEIDMDANDMQTEFEVGLEELLWFVNSYLGIAEEKQVDIIFNRDTIVNETEIIASMVSMGVEVSNVTKLSQLPFIDDPEAEQERVDKEKQEAMDAYGMGMNGEPLPGNAPMKPNKPAKGESDNEK